MNKKLAMPEVAIILQYIRCSYRIKSVGMESLFSLCIYFEMPVRLFRDVDKFEGKVGVHPMKFAWVWWALRATTFSLKFSIGIGSKSEWNYDLSHHPREWVEHMQKRQMSKTHLIAFSPHRNFTCWATLHREPNPVGYQATAVGKTSKTRFTTIDLISCSSFFLPGWQFVAAEEVTMA